MDEMSLAPSSGVSSFCSTAVRISWIRRPATCHFGSIVRPKSVGFIEANCWTRDGVTVAAIEKPPFQGRITVRPQANNDRAGERPFFRSLQDPIFPQSPQKAIAGGSMDRGGLGTLILCR